MSLLLAIVLAPVRLVRRVRHRRPKAGPKRVLVPFTRGGLERTVLDAAIRIARAEDATLVAAYLILVPLEFTLDAPMSQEVEVAMPLLEAVERASLRAKVPVDARVETGRTPIHALERLWAAERFDRIVVPAPAGRGPGFTPKDLLWILTHTPSETLILRPEPTVAGAPSRPTEEAFARAAVAP
jgi:nucleotide-binding universal stress UspA family protein